MSNKSSLAHPYASAAFELAKAGNSINEWLENLKILATAAQNKNFVDLISNPKIARSEVLETLLQLINNSNESIKAFLQLLQDNNRLIILADIAFGFEKLVADEQNTAKATIYSAFAMDESAKAEFERILSKKFNKNITATVEVQPELIGGIKVLINDVVIDASVKGSLNKMATQIII